MPKRALFVLKFFDHEFEESKIFCSNFDSNFANLFQFYNTRMPYFETVQFLRKGLLISALTWFADNPEMQAMSSFGINGSFLLLLSYTRPFVYYPTSNSRRNLFQIAEVSSTITCMIGNSLALIATFTGEALRGAKRQVGKTILARALVLCK